MLNNGYHFVGRYLNPWFPYRLNKTEVIAIGPYLFIGLLYEVSSWNSPGVDEGGYSGANAARAALKQLEAAGGGAGDGAIFLALDCVGNVFDSAYLAGAEQYTQEFLAELSLLGERQGVYTCASEMSTVLGWAVAGGFSPYTWLADYNGTCSGSPVYDPSYTFQQYVSGCSTSCFSHSIDKDTTATLTTPALW